MSFVLHIHKNTFTQSNKTPRVNITIHLWELAILTIYDMFSLKFVEFYEEKGVIPACIGSRRRDAHSML